MNAASQMCLFSNNKISNVSSPVPLEDTVHKRIVEKRQLFDLYFTVNWTYDWWSQKDWHFFLPSACSDISLVSWWSLLVTPEPPSTVSELLLSLVFGSLLGLGGGCFRVWLESSSPPPTECRDWDRTAKPWLAGGSRSWGAGIVIKPILKCFPEYAPSVTIATSSPILNEPMERGVNQ